MTNQFKLLYAQQANQFLREWKSPGVVDIADRFSADIKGPRRGKPADCRITPVNFACDLQVLGHKSCFQNSVGQLSRTLYSMSHDVEGEFDLISYANQPMRGRSCFDLEITAINAEFTLRPEIVSSNDDLCWNRD